MQVKSLITHFAVTFVERERPDQRAQTIAYADLVLSDLPEEPLTSEAERFGPVEVGVGLIGPVVVHLLAMAIHDVLKFLYRKWNTPMTEDLEEEDLQQLVVGLQLRLEAIEAHLINQGGDRELVRQLLQHVLQEGSRVAGAAGDGQGSKPQPGGSKPPNP